MSSMETLSSGALPNSLHERNLDQALSGDESWALALMNECERMDRNELLRPAPRDAMRHQQLMLLNQLDQDTESFEDFQLPKVEADMTAIERQISNLGKTCKKEAPSQIAVQHKAWFKRFFGFWS